MPADSSRYVWGVVLPPGATDADVEEIKAEAQRVSQGGDVLWDRAKKVAIYRWHARRGKALDARDVALRALARGAA